MLRQGNWGLKCAASQDRALKLYPAYVLFESELLSEVVSQVHSSSQISSNLALSRSLRRGRSAPASSSSPLSGPRLPSFTRGRPYGKRSSSSFRAGGRKRFRGGRGGGGGLLLPDLRVSGGRSHLLSGGCLSLHWQAWRDRGAEPWVVVLKLGYCLPFLSAPLSNVPIPMPSYSPTSIKGAALEEVTLGLIAKVLWSLLHSLLRASKSVCS